MHTKLIWKVVGIGILFFAFIAGVSVYTSQAPASIDRGSEAAVQMRTVTISIENLYSNRQATITAGDTVLEMLQKLNTEDSQLQLSTKDYSGLGTLVESMHGMTNGNQNKYWQYKVNEVMPQIGADRYELQDGDKVEWYFSISES